MNTFAGRWITTFGPMELSQDDGRIHGTYWFQGIPCTLEGTLQEGRFVFRYQDPSGVGEGWFQLASYGQIRGQYLLDGFERWGDWTGQREWDGIWDTSFGLVRLVQEEGRVHGIYDGAGRSRIEGRFDNHRVVFRYFEPQAQGEGWFKLADDALSFTGNWRPDGAANWGEWHGRRVLPRPGLTWLVVIEAHWQRSLADPEYSYGIMLKEFFARLPHVAVRHRFFNNEASLERWCRDLIYVPEPAIVLISSHGTSDGVTVQGETIDAKLVVNTLRHASNIKLLHFAACLMLKEEIVGDFARRIEKAAPFPISGYTTSVDWGGSAVLEFGYLDMMLAKGMQPEQAAERLPALITYAGEQTPAESPYVGVGFRFLKGGSSA